MDSCRPGRHYLFGKILLPSALLNSPRGRPVRRPEAGRIAAAAGRPLARSGGTLRPPAAPARRSGSCRCRCSRLCRAGRPLPGRCLRSPRSAPAAPGASRRCCRTWSRCRASLAMSTRSWTPRCAPPGRVGRSAEVVRRAGAGRAGVGLSSLESPWASDGIPRTQIFWQRWNPKNFRQRWNPKNANIFAPQSKH